MLTLLEEPKEHRIEEKLAKEEASKIEARKDARKRNKILGIVAAAVCLCIGFFVLLNNVIIPNIKFANPQVGYIVYFGSYEQDNVAENGKELIEWIVLDVDETNGQMLLLSKYALDCKPFDYRTIIYTDVWANAPIRSWLNGYSDNHYDYSFIDTAFTAEEQSKIASTTIDEIFLLSYNEVTTTYSNIFTTDEDRRCSATAYATAQGAKKFTDYNGKYVDSALGTCYWWLRSQGYNSHRGAGVYDVDFDGYVYSGYFVGNTSAAVRPALWVSYK